MKNYLEKKPVVEPILYEEWKNQTSQITQDLIQILESEMLNSKFGIRQFSKN